MTDPASGYRARTGQTPPKQVQTSPKQVQTSPKQVLRSRVRARRGAAQLPAGDRSARAAGLCAGASVVACYASLPQEPDTRDLIERLASAGTRILLPVLRRDPDWAWYTGPENLAVGRRGIPEPTSAPLGAAALGEAEWIWVPGLAATPAGDRLGTGGGWYDRALAHAAPTAQVGLLLHDGEVFDALPTDPWDRRVQVVLTASDTLWAAE